MCVSVPVGSAGQLFGLVGIALFCLVNRIMSVMDYCVAGCVCVRYTRHPSSPLIPATYGDTLSLTTNTNIRCESRGAAMLQGSCLQFPLSQSTVCFCSVFSALKWLIRSSPKHRVRFPIVNVHTVVSRRLRVCISPGFINL